MQKTIGVLAAILLAACGGSSEPAPPVDLNEPNDTIETATPVAATGTVQAAIGSEGDLDYYTFTIPSGGRVLRVQTFDSSGTTCSGVDPAITVFDSTSSVLAWDDDSAYYTVPGYGWCEDLSVALAEGTYYVLVEVPALPAIPAYSAPYAYALRLDTAFFPALLETEPNDTRATADGPYTADALIGAAISPGADLDYYAVENTTASAVSVHFETFSGPSYCSASVDTSIRVVDSTGTAVASDDDGGLPYCSAVTYSIPAYSTVYVEVSDYMKRGFPYYELWIDFP